MDKKQLTLGRGTLQITHPSLRPQAPPRIQLHYTPARKRTFYTTKTKLKQPSLAIYNNLQAILLCKNAITYDNITANVDEHLVTVFRKQEKTEKKM